MLSLFAKRILQIKLIHAKLVRHHYIPVIRNLLRDPVMASNGLQPPDLILILECDAILLIGSEGLQKTSQAKHTFPSTVDVRKHQIYNIFLTDAARHFLFPVLRRLVFHQRICAKHPGIGRDGLSGSHSHVLFIHAAGRPDSFSFHCIWNRCKLVRMLWKFHFHMRQHRTVSPLLLLWMNDYKFFRGKMTGSGIIVPGDHGGSVIRCMFSYKNRCTSHVCILLMSIFLCNNLTAGYRKKQ